MNLAQLATNLTIFLTKLEKDCININVDRGQIPMFTRVPIRDSKLNLA